MTVVDGPAVGGLRYIRVISSSWSSGWPGMWGPLELMCCNVSTGDSLNQHLLLILIHNLIMCVGICECVRLCLCMHRATTASTYMAIM